MYDGREQSCLEEQDITESLRKGIGGIGYKCISNKYKQEVALLETLQEWLLARLDDGQKFLSIPSLAQLSIAVSFQVF